MSRSITEETQLTRI